MSDRYERVSVSSREQWRAWLDVNHARSPGAWVVTWKKASAGPHVRGDDIAEEALCYGWVDSIPRALDAERSMLLVTPRKPSSRWSRVNKERVERLTAAGVMHDSGLAAVALARANGTWSALDAVERLEEPDDLRAALEATPGARAHWDGFPRTAKRAILEWITGARRPETRASRVEETARLAARGERANQWRRPPPAESVTGDATRG